MASIGEVKKVKGENGNYLVETLENGYSHRTASPHSKPAHHLRPQSYRRKTRVGCPALPAGYGPGLQWSDCGKISDDKIRFFVNTAHDIRTPLTLIKAPLEELSDREKLSKEGTDNLSTALRNVNALLRLTTNLINFERADTYSNN